MRVHSDQTEFCMSYDFLIASSRAPIVKAPLSNIIHVMKCWISYIKFTHSALIRTLRALMGVVSLKICCAIVMYVVH